TARVQGFFAAEGIEVDIALTPNSTDQMRGLSQGKFDIVSTALITCWLGRDAKARRLSQSHRFLTRQCCRFSSGPKSKTGATSGERNSPPMLWTPRLRWYLGASCWRTVWT